MTTLLTKTWHRLPLVLAGLLFVASCKVSKDLPLPQLPLPATYRTATNTDTTSVVNLPWRSFFTEPALQQLLDSATVRNNDLQLAIQNIASAQATLKQARLGYPRRCKRA
jgi:multidrug efflux system outer membrane protein